MGKGIPVESGATQSETPAAPGIDPEKNLIFVDDYFLKGVSAIHLDQRTGAEGQVGSSGLVVE